MKSLLLFSLGFSLVGSFAFPASKKSARPVFKTIPVLRSNLKCNPADTEVKTISLQCRMTSLDAYVGVVLPDDSGGCVEERDPDTAAIVAFRCSCVTRKPLTCVLSDDIANVRNSPVCGEGNGQPPSWKLCRQQFSIPGPHLWGSKTITAADGESFTALVDDVTQGRPPEYKLCVRLMDSGELFAEARNRCRMNRVYQQWGGEHPTIQVDGIPCCAPAPVVNETSVAD